MHLLHVNAVASAEVVRTLASDDEQASRVTPPSLLQIAQSEAARWR